MDANQSRPRVVVSRVVRRRVSVQIIRAQGDVIYRDRKRMKGGKDLRRLERILDKDAVVNHKLVVDGSEVGFAMREGLPESGAVFRYAMVHKYEKNFHYPKVQSYPNAIALITVYLSNGQRMTLASDEIRYLTADNVRQILHSVEGKFTPQIYAPTRAKIGEREYHFQEAIQLQRGSVIEWDQPFRLDQAKRVVTNGDVSVPCRRPHGKEDWKRWPRIASLQAITETNWELMLEVIIGLYLDEVLNLDALKDRVTNERMKRREQERTGQRLAKLLHGQCYDGGSATSVSIGANLIFSLNLQGGERIHLVDSPEYGRGLYVFDTYEDAHAWARRSLDMTEARRRAKAFIPHREHWRERLSEVLSDVAQVPDRG